MLPDAEEMTRERQMEVLLGQMLRSGEKFNDDEEEHHATIAQLWMSTRELGAA